MSKKLLFAVIGSAFIGFIGHNIVTNPQQVQQWITTIFTTTQGLTQPIQAMVQNLISNIQQNPVPTLTGIGFGAAPIILIASKAYSTVKTRLSSQVQQVIDQKNIAELQATQKLEGMQTRIETLEQENQALISAPISNQEPLTEAQNMVIKKQEEIKLLTARYEGRIKTFEEEVKRLEDRLRVKQFVK